MNFAADCESRNSWNGEIRNIYQREGMFLPVQEKGREMNPLAAGGKTGRVASNEMCTFLILNSSSLQLIPVNMIAYEWFIIGLNKEPLTTRAIFSPIFMRVLTKVDAMRISSHLANAAWIGWIFYPTHLQIIIPEQRNVTIPILTQMCRFWKREHKAQMPERRLDHQRQCESGAYGVQPFL